MSNRNKLYSYITTQEELQEYVISTLVTLSIVSNNSIVDVGIDFETYVREEYRLVSSGLDCYCNTLRLVSINWLDNCGPPIVVDISTVDIKPLLVLISDSTKYIVWAHNASFEIKQIKHHYNLELTNIYCSLVMFNTLYVSIGWRQGKLIGSSLSSIMRHFAGVVMDKTLQTSDWSNSNLSSEQLAYSAMDVSSEWLNLILSVKASLISDYNQEYAFNLDQEAMRILSIVEYVGFRIDKDKMSGFIDDLQVKSNDSKIELAKKLDLPLSVELKENDEGILEHFLSVSPIVTKTFNSPVKLVSLINKKFGVGLTALNAIIMKEFLVSSDDVEDEEEEDEDDTLSVNSIIGKEEAKDVINCLITYKRQEKLITEISKYNSIINPVSQALHATTNPVGAGTGRMSSASSIIVGTKKYKMNVQQVIAKGKYDIRSGYIAREGYSIAGIDFTAEEVLTAMAYAKDDVGLSSFYERKKNPYLLDDLGNKVLDDDNEFVLNPYTDPHVIAAIGLCPALSTYSPQFVLAMSKGEHDGIDYRFRGKTLNFSVIYGKTAQGLSEDMKCSVEEAEKVLNSYFNKYFKLKEWLDRSSRDAIRNKRITLPTGRVVWVDEANSKGIDNSAGRKGPNSFVQSLCADQLKMTLPVVRKYLEDFNSKYKVRNNILATIHKQSSLWM